MRDDRLTKTPVTRRTGPERRMRMIFDRGLVCGSVRLSICASILSGFLLALSACEASAEQTIRNVSPPWVTRAVRPGGYMQDIPASVAPLPATAPPLKKQKLRLRPGGEILVNGKSVHMTAIRLPPRDTLCPGPNNGRWACGAAAFVAWSNLLRVGNVRCDENTEAAVCTTNGRPLDEVLVGAGWALPAPPAPESLQTLESQAKEQRIGIYGESPNTRTAASIAR
jgi:endonuclease YncB( thermonuclease family)